jgi:coproporphyrinogen III oxidase
MINIRYGIICIITMKNKFYHTKPSRPNCCWLKAVEGQKNQGEDLWNVQAAEEEHVIENGNVIEKGGVNISAVHGKLRFMQRCSM